MRPDPGPVINAAGFVTTLAGAGLHPAAAAAFTAAAQHSWDVAELSEHVGAKIAELTRTPAACVVAGAGAGLALAVAACAVRDSPALAAALPVPGRFTVVAQAALHNSYDRMARLCGAQITPIGYATRPGLGQTLAWELEAAVEERPTAVLHTITADSGALPLTEVAAIAHTQNVPVVVDAAAGLPPAGNMSRFIAEGADLAVFSGGKALRGPQSSGLLLGHPDLVRSARYQQLDMDTDPNLWHARSGSQPWHHGIGRAMKVGPETMLATLAALRQFLTRDHDQEAAEMTGWLRDLAATLGTGQLITPGTAGGFYPSLTWDLPPDRARQAWQALASHQPSIRLGQSELAAGRLRLRPEALAHGQRDLVTSALVNARTLLQPEP